MGVKTKEHCLTMNTSDRRRRAYQCLKCLHKYNRTYIEARYRVVSHILKHHVVPDEVPYHCTLCMFKCTKREELDQHVSSFKRHKLLLKEKGIQDSPSMLIESLNPYQVSNSDMVALSAEESARHWSGRIQQKQQTDILSDAVQSIFSHGLYDSEQTPKVITPLLELPKSPDSLSLIVTSPSPPSNLFAYIQSTPSLTTTQILPAETSHPTTCNTVAPTWSHPSNPSSNMLTIGQFPHLLNQPQPQLEHAHAPLHPSANAQVPTQQSLPQIALPAPHTFVMPQRHPFQTAFVPSYITDSSAHTDAPQTTKPLTPLQLQSDMPPMPQVLYTATPVTQNITETAQVPTLTDAPQTTKLLTSLQLQPDISSAPQILYTVEPATQNTESVQTTTPADAPQTTQPPAPQSPPPENILHQLLPRDNPTPLFDEAPRPNSRNSSSSSSSNSTIHIPVSLFNSIREAIELSSKAMLEKLEEHTRAVRRQERAMTEMRSALMEVHDALVRNNKEKPPLLRSQKENTGRRRH